MSFKDFDIKISYRNVGEEQLMDAINPFLASSKYYKRSGEYKFAGIKRSL